LRQALALDPTHVPAILALGEQAMMAADAERALAIFLRASQQQPEQLWFQLGIVEALTALGRTQQALEHISGIRAAHGDFPSIYLKRLDLLRQSGRCLESLRLAREATAQFPYHFWLHVERFHSEILLGSAAEIVACLDAVPAGTANEKATLERLRGNFAEAFWHIEDAITHYETAASFNPQDPWCLYDLVRVKILTLDLASARRHLLRFSDLTAHVSRLRRRPLNISQTHYGELLNDYAVNQDLLSQFRLLQHLAARPRAIALKHAVRDNPDSTAAAVSLMLALRLSGGFARRPFAEAVKRIPQQIAQFWDSESVPEDVAELTQSWREHNPDYKVRLFTEQTAAAFLSAWIPAPVLQAFQRA
jgi:tetratricopeptide (TPR) repeat protein